MRALKTPSNYTPTSPIMNSHLNSHHPSNNFTDFANFASLASPNLIFCDAISSTVKIGCATLETKNAIKFYVYAQPLLVPPYVYLCLPFSLTLSLTTLSLPLSLSFTNTSSSSAIILIPQTLKRLYRLFPIFSPSQIL